MSGANDVRRHDDHGWIEVTGARTHNLRDISVRIPRGKLVAFTGVSGSGKTSLAVDTVHAEAQLRYLEGISPFVRRYLGQRDRPEVDRITGLGATLAVDQRRLNNNPRSTMATVTGMDAYLGLVYSRLPALRTGAELATTSFDRFSPEGACPVCHGAGGTVRADAELIIDKPELPLFSGGSHWFAKWRSGEHSFIPALAELHRVDLSVPWRDLPATFQHAVLHGTGEQVIDASVTIPSRATGTEWTYSSSQPMRGALAEVERVFANAGSETSKQRYQRYMRMTPCQECAGSGFGEAARTVTVGGRTYPELITLTGTDLIDWVHQAEAELGDQDRAVGLPLLRELGARLTVLHRTGLSHLQLSREASTLSGGELQRARLAAQLSTPLEGITFVLDEPTSGLHPADKADVLDMLKALRDNGNSVLLVEHDPEIVKACDWVVDIGPGAGRDGGHLLISAPPAEAAHHETSPTAAYLSGRKQRVERKTRNADPARWLTVRDISNHNVDVADVRVPQGRLTCLTGPSGSGKSSLLHAFASAVEADDTAPVAWVAVVDQDPIGRTPRSNPATYSKAFDAIRTLFASTDHARKAELNASTFSFNTAGGRCEDCSGHGRKLVDMHFLPDVWVTCTTCAGRRFTQQVLDVEYQGLSIDAVLDLTVDEAAEFFTDPDSLVATLHALRQVGLGYVTLGQSATDLSGGEAQRLKLATTIQRGNRGRKRGLVVLDEPVTGLHPADVQRLVEALDVLIDAGNTVVVAEHDLHLAARADWIIDLGPGAGPAGGRVVATGTPADLVTADTKTARYLQHVLS
ncbi:excinuclease ABC subunit A [Streptomyces sp. NWU339]|uniref:excinuclease ABC subunit UvrA n=1 Tax=Streptomyces sp. NWU339 TaxID=2185284 RepID=UPI000D67272C|nr:excinuclease ABC subunit UvrA [Streptomyces sp. NWU339]PWI05419.1 excinuclease ABC subunit A [Streptomyces sp. NWU339]